MRQLCRHIATLALRTSATLALALGFALLSPTPTPANCRHTEERALELETGYVQVGLASIARWEGLLSDRANPLTGIDRRVVAESLLEELTRLCEVDKLPAAERHLKELLRREGPELTRFGFDPSGSLCANVSGMRLMNPAFAKHTILLFRLENRSPFPLGSGGKTACELVTVDGARWQLEELTPKHPLYPDLSRMAAQFRMPDSLRPGTIASFELILNRPAVAEKDIAYLVLSFGDWRIVIKFYENI